MTAWDWHIGGRQPMTRRRASGTRRTTDSSRDGDRGDHLDQLLDDNPDADDADDRDANDQDQDGDRDQGDDLADDPDDADRSDDRNVAGRGRKGQRRRARTDDEDEDNDRDRPVTVEDLEKAAQRIADRQVNALLRRLDKPGARDQQDQNDRGGRRRRDDRDRDGDSSRDDTQRQDEQRRYDEREARLAFRDYVSADGRNMATTEREIANTLARVEITTRLDEHGDPDRAGREAADRVTDQLAEFRKLVEKQTVAALRKRGALRERSTTGDDEDTAESGNAGGSRPPGRAPSPAKLADKRQAAKSFAADYNTRLGHTTTTDAGANTG